MGNTACLVCLISTVSGRCKKKENALQGTQQNFNNLYSLDIYDYNLYAFKAIHESDRKINKIKMTYHRLL